MEKTKRAIATLCRPEASFVSGWGRRSEKASVAWPISFHVSYFVNREGRDSLSPKANMLGSVLDA